MAGHDQAGDCAWLLSLLLSGAGTTLIQLNRGGVLSVCFWALLRRQMMSGLGAKSPLNFRGFRIRSETLRHFKPIDDWILNQFDHTRSPSAAKYKRRRAATFDLRREPLPADSKTPLRHQIRRAQT